MGARDLEGAVDEIVAAAASAPRLMALFDFDGTLAPIVADPDDAVILPRARDALRVLAQLPGATVGIVSGRSLSDLKPRIPVEGVILAGNYGLEVQGLGLGYVEPIGFLLEPKLAAIAAEIRKLLSAVPGLILEDKRLTMTVHTRGAAEEAARHVERVLEAVVRPDTGFMWRAALASFEIIPANGWNKGRAIEWMRKSLHLDNAFTLFIGDDVSDEDAFEQLPDAVTIRVGGPPTNARFTARSIEEIAALVEKLGACMQSGAVINHSLTST